MGFYFVSGIPVTAIQLETVLRFNLDPYRCNKTLQNFKYYSKYFENIWDSCNEKNDMNFTFHFYNERREDEVRYVNKMKNKSVTISLKTI